VPKCAQVHGVVTGVPTSRMANVKHGPEFCLVEAVRLERETRREGESLRETDPGPRSNLKALAQSLRLLMRRRINRDLPGLSRPEDSKPLLSPKGPGVETLLRERERERESFIRSNLHPKSQVLLNPFPTTLPSPQHRLRCALSPPLLFLCMLLPTLTALPQLVLGAFSCLESFT